VHDVTKVSKRPASASPLGNQEPFETPCACGGGHVTAGARAAAAAAADDHDLSDATVTTAQ